MFQFPIPCQVASGAEVPAPGDLVTPAASIDVSAHWLCLFCGEGNDETRSTEALLCEHVFHSDCIEAYCEATSRLRARACPFRCWEEERAVVAPIVIPADEPVGVVRSLSELADLADAVAAAARAAM